MKPEILLTPAEYMKMIFSHDSVHVETTADGTLYRLGQDAYAAVLKDVGLQYFLIKDYYMESK